MRRTRLCSLGIIVVLTSLICTGCATSLQPLATKDVRTDVADVEGAWIVENSTLDACEKGAILTISRLSVGRYDVRVTRDGKTTGWDCETVMLNKTMFIDMFMQKTEQDDEPERVLQIGTHAIFVLRRDETSLSLVGFDHTKLDKAAHDEKVVAPSPRNDRVVFVADTVRLQEFFAKHGVECAQPEPSVVLKRLEPAKAADEIQELPQAMSPRFAPTATDINNARDEVRTDLVLYSHYVQHGPGVFSLGVEFENLSISHYARIEFNATDPKLEMLDESNKPVPQLPVVRTGPVPANQIAVIPPGSRVTFSTIYPGSGMNGATGQLTSGNHTWRVAAGRYRVRGTVPAKVSLAKGEFQEERPPSRYLPPSEWPKDVEQVELKLPLAEFSVPKKALQ